MAKEKKLTITYFPRKSKKSGEYSIYSRITYDRKSTMISINQFVNADDLEDAQEKINKEIKDNKYSVYHHDMGLFSDLIAYEIEKYRNNYSIVGFKERYNIYIMKVGAILGQKLLMNFLSLLEDEISFKKYNEVYDFMKVNKVSFPLNLFNSIKFIKESYDIEVRYDIKAEIFKLVFSLCAINLFSYEKSKAVKLASPDFPDKEFFFTKQGYSSLEPVYLWVLNKPRYYNPRRTLEGIKRENFKTIREEFIDFYNQDDIYNKIDKYTENKLSNTFSPNEFNPVSGQKIISCIIGECEKLIK